MSFSGLPVRRDRDGPVRDRRGRDVRDRRDRGIDELLIEELRDPRDHVGRGRRLRVDGLDSRTSSSVRMTIPAAFAIPSVAVANPSFVTGFGAPCPTHPYDAARGLDGDGDVERDFPEVRDLPEDRRGAEERDELVRHVLHVARAPAQVGSVVVPGATAALRIQLDLRRRILPAFRERNRPRVFAVRRRLAITARTNAVPFGRFVLT